MPEYIERDPVIEKIDNLEPPVFYADGNLDWYQEGFKDALKEVSKILENQPTADVAEVEHGKWINTKPAHYACSICNKNVGGVTFNYCPDCGTKMDKE